MKICVAQTRPDKGNIAGNISNQVVLVELACSHAADLIIFPELSITGYEPVLCAILATNQHDSRFAIFQKISDDRQISIGIGVPIAVSGGVNISMVIFRPFKTRKVYSKKYLHPDEDPFFCSGQNLTGLAINNTSIAFAICYELSIAEHAADAFECGAAVYIASVAKSATGVDTAIESLSAIAKKYSMTVLLSNCVGYCDTFYSGGKTAAWNNNGILAGQLNDVNEGVLVYDTVTGDAVTETI